MFGYLRRQFLIQRCLLSERQVGGLFVITVAGIEKVIGRVVGVEIVGKCVLARTVRVLRFLVSVVVFSVLLFVVAFIVIALLESLVFENLVVNPLFKIPQRKFKKVHLQKLLRCQRLRKCLFLGLYESLCHETVSLRKYKSSYK